MSLCETLKNSQSIDIFHTTIFIMSNLLFQLFLNEFLAVTVIAINSPLLWHMQTASILSRTATQAVTQISHPSRCIYCVGNIRNFVA